MILRGVASAKGSCDIVREKRGRLVGRSRRSGKLERLNKGHDVDRWDCYIRGLSLHSQHPS